MIEWTSKNHFKYGYSNWFDYLYSSETPLKIEYGIASNIDDLKLSWRSECIKAAKLIGDSATKPICILMSGGLDAELTASSFIEAGVPFEAATLEYKSPYKNSHETELAKIFCKRYGINHTVYEMDLDHFVANEAITYAKKIRVFEGFRATKLWLVDKIVKRGFYPVVGQGEMLIVKGTQLASAFGRAFFSMNKKIERELWYFVENEAVFAWNKHFTFNNIEGCPCFFQYTPDQMYAYLKEQTTIELISNKTSHLTNELYKFEQYSQAFNSIVETREVYSGFEKYLNLEDRLFDQYFSLSKIYGYKRRTSILLFEYKEILKHLEGKEREGA